MRRASVRTMAIAYLVTGYPWTHALRLNRVRQLGRPSDRRARDAAAVRRNRLRDGPAGPSLNARNPALASVIMFSASQLRFVSQLRCQCSSFFLRMLSIVLFRQSGKVCSSFADQLATAWSRRLRSIVDAARTALAAAVALGGHRLAVRDHPVLVHPAIRHDERVRDEAARRARARARPGSAGRAAAPCTRTTARRGCSFRSRARIRRTDGGSRSSRRPARSRAAVRPGRSARGRTRSRNRTPSRSPGRRRRAARSRG